MRPARALALLFFLAFAACESDDPLRPVAGGIRVTLTLEGLDLDPDGALIQVDGRVPVPLANGASLGLEATPGIHRLLLTGLTRNCEVPDGEGRLVEVEEGTFTDAVFSVRCVATSGVVLVYLAEQGSGSDRNGYLVSVDSGMPQRTLGQSGAGFAPVAGGLHSITLSDIARSCAVVGDNPLTGVQVRAGTLVRDTVRVTMTLACTGGSGSLELITRTSGPADSDGYIITLDSPAIQVFRVPANGLMVLNGLEVGPLWLSIFDVAANCEAAASSTSVPIVAGDTVSVVFAVQCVEPAVLRVTAPTSGASLDPGYVVRVDQSAEARALLLRDTLSLDLVPGDHEVRLEDIAPNCSVGSGNPVTVSLSSAAPTLLVFPVGCEALNRTGIDLTLTTTGHDTDDGYLLTLCLGHEGECWSPAARMALASTATLQLDLAPGTYYPILTEMADNCHVTSAPGIAVVAGQVSGAQIAVTCVAFADFTATATVAGSDVPQEFYLLVDGRERGYFPVSQPTRFASFEGEHTIELSRIPANCHSVSANPVSLTLVAGVLTPLGFTVACVSHP